jgi:hypothetical protein
MTYEIEIKERAKTGIKFDLYVVDFDTRHKLTGPCGLTMDLSTFEDFCDRLGIDYDIAE